MKVLVIGGNNFFGIELVNQLLEKDFEVHVMNRGNHSPVYRGEIKHHICDRENIEQFTELAELAWDIVFDQFCMNEAHAKTAIKLFSGKCKKYVMTSSQSVYDAGSSLGEGDFSGAQYIYSEKMMERNAYAENKRRADSTFLKSKELNSLIIRPPIVLGELDSTQRLKWHIERILKGSEIHFPSLEAKISFVNSIDLAKNIVHLAISNIEGAVNICSQDPISLRDLVLMIEKFTAKKLVRAKRKSDENHSPYGIEQDWWMSSLRLEKSGGQTRPIADWLPQLIQYNLDQLSQASKR